MDARIKSGHDKCACMDTLGQPVSSPRRETRPGFFKVSSLLKRGRGKYRAPFAPAASRAKKAHKTSHCGCSRISPAFPAAMVLRFPSCSPRRPGLLSPSAAQRVSVVAVLISASGDQAHTTSPSAISTVRLSVDSRPSHPAPNVRDDRETPLLIGRDEQIVARDLPVVTRKRTCDTLARRANQHRSTIPKL